MGNKLYVGNLPYSVRDSDLEQAFSQFGAVTSAKVMMERDTGRSKGFGFVEMGSDAEAQAAINGMNGQPLGGRSVEVNEARPMEARPDLPARRHDPGALDDAGSAFFVQERHQGLADAQLRDGFLDVEGWVLPEGRGRRLDRFLIARREGTQGVLHAVAQLAEHGLR